MTSVLEYAGVCCPEPNQTAPLSVRQRVKAERAKAVVAGDRFIKGYRTDGLPQLTPIWRVESASTHKTGQPVTLPRFSILEKGGF